jgi:hypothetical protein
MVRTHRRGGFSLIELGIVILLLAVLGGLMAVALVESRTGGEPGVDPAIVTVREVGSRTQSQHNLHMLVLAVHDYASATNNTIPPGFDKTGMFNNRGGGTMFYYLLPYVEGDAIYSNLLPDKVDTPFKGYIAPGDPTHDGKAAFTSYAINPNMSDPTILPGSFQRGTSNTVAFVERAAVCQDGGRRYANTRDWDFDATGGPREFEPPQGNRYATAFSKASCQIGMMDGSVRGVRIDQPSFPIACLLKQGNPPQPLGPDW